MNRHQMRRRGQFGRRFVLLAVLGVPLLAGCKSTEPTAGPTQAAEPVQVPVGSFARSWRADLPVKDAPITRLALLNDRLFVYTADNRVYWINREFGTVLEVARPASQTDTVYNPIAMDGQVIFPSTKQLSVYDQRGKLLHRIETRYNVSSNAAADAGMLFYGVDHINGGRVVARDITPSPYPISPKWELLTRGQVSAGPAAHQGLIFSASRDGAVYAVRAEDRSVLWPGLEGAVFRTGGPILADLAADKDGVFVASTDTKLYNLDPNNGNVRWTFYAGVPLRENSAPITTPSAVYIYVPGTGLVAIDKAGRQEIRRPKWIVADAVQFLSQDDTHAYLRTGDNRIMAVDRQTGEPVFRSLRNDFTLFVSNTKDVTIYAAKANGELYAIVPVHKPGTVGEIVLHERPADAVAMR